MTIANTTSQFDTTLGFIIPENTGTWADFSGETWADWTQWINAPADPMVHSLPPTDLTSNVYFNLTTKASVVGNLTYDIHVSQTGLFAGEEVTTTITAPAPGEVTGNLSAFYGRYVLVQANVVSTSGLTSLHSLSYQVTNEPFEIRLNDLDLGELTANGNAYIVPLGKTVGAVTNMQTTPSLSPSGNVLITNTISKDRNAPTVGVYYLTTDGSSTPAVRYVTEGYAVTDYFDDTEATGGVSGMAAATEGQFDAVVNCLPPQGRDRNNLVTL